jgi:GntR family histidine utilization transcriptional repressor
MTVRSAAAATTKNGSMHQRILRDVEDRILSGDWAPGHRVPYEHELTAIYGCSRMTVNKVMSELSARGLINRRRRAGSFVAQPENEQSVLDIHDFAAEAARRGVTHRYQLLARRVDTVAKTDRRPLGLKPGAEVLSLTGLHRFDGIAVALEARLVNLAAVPGARGEAFDTVAPGTWLLRQVPWSEAEHVIRAVSADAAIAKALGIAKGAACLVLERYTWQSGVPITEVRLVHPGDRHHFVGRFRPASASAIRTSAGRGRRRGRL